MTTFTSSITFPNISEFPIQKRLKILKIHFPIKQLKIETINCQNN